MLYKKVPDKMKIIQTVLKTHLDLTTTYASNIFTLPLLIDKVKDLGTRCKFQANQDKKRAISHLVVTISLPNSFSFFQSHTTAEETFLLIKIIFSMVLPCNITYDFRTVPMRAFILFSSS